MAVDKVDLFTIDCIGCCLSEDIFYVGYLNKSCILYLE